jgi:hypothetical protein
MVPDMVPDMVPALSRKEWGVAVWQFGSATRREGASRSRDSFVNCPGQGLRAHAQFSISGPHNHHLIADTQHSDSTSR